MKQKPVVALVVLVAVIILTAGCSLKGGTSAQGADNKKQAVQVVVQQVKKMEIKRTLVLSGEAQPEQNAVVAPKISGRITSVAVDVGAHVNAGDVLFRLDDSDIAAQIAQSEAAVEVARANLEVSEKNKESSAAQLERYKQLYEQKAISADTYDTYKLKYEQAASGVPESTLKQSQANLAYQRLQMENTLIKSPINGVVSQRNVEPGEMVLSSTQALRLVDLSAVRVKINISEKEVGKIRPGQQVDVRVPSAGQEPFHGVVFSVSPSADSKSKTYPVEVRVDNRQGLIKEGMFTEVTFITDRLPDTLAVSVDALVPKGDKKSVFVYKGDQVEERAVELGISDGMFQAVLQGLTKGDMVVVKGQQGLTDGVKVVLQGAGQGGQSPKQASGDNVSQAAGGQEPASKNKE